MIAAGHSSGGSGGGISAGAIAGGVVGGVAALGISVAIVFYVRSHVVLTRAPKHVIRVSGAESNAGLQNILKDSRKASRTNLVDTGLSGTQEEDVGPRAYTLRSAQKQNMPVDRV